MPSSGNEPPWNGALRRHEIRALLRAGIAPHEVARVTGEPPAAVRRVARGLEREQRPPARAGRRAGR
jgi:hypothetical protein